MMTKYILDAGGCPAVCPDLAAWGAWYQSANRCIARTELQDIIVSTVFLGIDHNFGAHGPPLLFETMLFAFNGVRAVDYIKRYSTRPEAVAGHTRAVDWVLGGMK